MKPQKNNYLKNSVALLILSFTSLSVSGQNIACPEVAVAVQNEPITLLAEIGVNDYQHFLNLSSLQRFANIQYRGLKIGNFKNRNYDLISNSKQMKLFATYGEDGNLIKGRLTKKDSRLPIFIREHLSTYRIEGWKMISNKTFINDFDPLMTEYEVELQRDNKKRTVFFDYSGKRIKKISRRKA